MNKDKEKLYLLWTNADLDTSEYMVFMYVTNSMLKGWWNEVEVIIWGATAKLVAENADIQEKIMVAKEAGVKFTACISCARRLGVMDKLDEMDIELRAWGDPLTKVIKNGEHLITV